MKREFKYLYIISNIVYLALLAVGLLFIFESYNFGVSWAGKEVDTVSHQLKIKTGITIYIITGTVLFISSAVGFIINYYIIIKRKIKVK